MMNEQDMYNRLRDRISTNSNSSMFIKEVGLSILEDFINNIDRGMYPKYAYHRANSKIDILLESFFKKVLT